MGFDLGVASGPDVKSNSCSRICFNTMNDFEARHLRAFSCFLVFRFIEGEAE